MPPTATMLLPSDPSPVEQSLVDRLFVALQRSPHLPARNLRIESNEGRVTLTGTVRSYYQKQMAQETVRRLEGVREVRNHLEVHWS